MHFEVVTKYNLSAYRKGVILLYNFFSKREIALWIAIFAMGGFFALLAYLKSSETYFYLAILCLYNFLGQCIVSVAPVFVICRRYKEKLQKVYGNTDSVLHLSFYDTCFCVRGPLREIKVPYKRIICLLESKQYFHLATDVDGIIYSIDKQHVDEEAFREFIVATFNSIKKTGDGTKPLKK